MNVKRRKNMIGVFPKRRILMRMGSCRRMRTQQRTPPHTTMNSVNDTKHDPDPPRRQAPPSRDGQ